ncbi:MAG: NAD(P)H-dependent dehydrogenase/reductase [Desulfuromonas sp.]|nr:MAG: NAD(P)H-dependent dehydrogenase/reductase [Desulfuromonas sp.]
MSDFIHLLRNRRSIRLFSDHSIPSEQIALLEEALLRAPTSRGRNPWQFIKVSDKDLLQKLAQAKMKGSGFLAGAALAYAICADETVSDVWIEDCSIAAITLQYSAHSLGLGSCWAQIRLREHKENESAETFVRNLLGIPEQVRVASIIGLGYPNEKKDGHPAESLPSGKIHQNRFS